MRTATKPTPQTVAAPVRTHNQRAPSEDEDEVRENDFPAGHVPLYKGGVINGGVPLHAITSYTVDGSGRERVFIRTVGDTGAGHVVTSDVPLLRFLSQLIDAQESLED
jgi:hypothetical protein